MMIKRFLVPVLALAALGLPAGASIVDVLCTDRRLRVKDLERVQFE